MKLSNCACWHMPRITERSVGTVLFACADPHCIAATPECDIAAHAAKVWQAMQSEAMQ